ncbi:Bug family tripartite tricarboxylate transporter substrate binding protein [Variovorax terrae]|uniref:Twin-arginine translocation pathway signal protein n=1 Tax=Variovorax terrae TaxID=2923278 RepID=A0A9X2ARZ6_9BURK|nr:tripartite tricarboxylate transporter substrate-binding protein [Variovorax terrae]MCJ0766042.1 twin-arginine translocation pathway signal protein [Variovorax terrae]
MTTRRHFVRSVAAATALPAMLAPWAARAQNTTPPIKQLTLVVPFPAGGATDAVARLVAENGLRGRYAENVVVENRAGAGGRVGVEYVKNRPADGSTMLYTPTFPISIFPHIYKKLSYDAMADFTPVAPTSKGMLGLAIGPGVPASVTTLAEFVAWCKANPARSNFGTASGSSQHFAGVMFSRAAGIELRLVPYKGGAPAVVDLLGGHVSSTVSPLPEIIPHAADGKLRILAVTGSKRSRFLPNVPTMVESGYRDVVFQDWSGVLAPAKTAPELVARANAAISGYVRSDKGIEALAQLGTEADAQGVAEFGAAVKSSWERYRAIVQSTGFTAED